MVEEQRAKSGEQPHSAPVLDDWRDLWWNADFLALTARRWRLDRVTRVLDAGCGHGHWGQVWAEHLPPESTLIGIDREPAWVDEATRRAGALGLEKRFTYHVADARDLPFADGAFDWVTCQTLLMHVAEPHEVLQEMARVLAPGGLVSVSEPSNLALSLILDSVAAKLDVDTLAEIVRFELICHRGRIAAGEGDHSIGERVPELMEQTGLVDINVHINDRAVPVLGDRSAQATSLLEKETQLFDNRLWIWNRDVARQMYLRGGGNPTRFEELYRLFNRRTEAFVEAVRSGTYRRSGAQLQYLVLGRKPG
jgi:SAM-dependent methyltransferase